MEICYIWVSFVEDNEDWLVVSKNSSTSGFLAYGSNGKSILDLKEKASLTTLLYRIKGSPKSYLVGYKYELLLDGLLGSCIM
jgi:hypothetical protein